MVSSFSLDTGAALTELAGLLLSSDTLELLLQGVAELSVRAVPTATTCGITIAPDGKPRTVASADALAAELDEHQYDRFDGPCLQSLRSGDVVSAPDLAVDERWGDYPISALRLGVRSVLATPLLVEAKPIGVINLYARAAHAFSEADLQVAGLLAGVAATTVAVAVRRHDELALTDNLRSALLSRSVIDQAIGIVMARTRCGPEEAFATLRTSSQRRNVKLRVIAAEVVSAVAGPSG